MNKAEAYALAYGMVVNSIKESIKLMCKTDTDKELIKDISKEIYKKVSEIEIPEEARKGLLPEMLMTEEELEKYVEEVLEIAKEYLR